MLNRESTMRQSSVERLQGISSGNRMVLPIQQEKVAYNHHFEWIASPSGEQVIPHHVPFRL
jgi:hypothetical protein